MKNDTRGFIALAKQFHRENYADQVVLPTNIVKSGENITINGITYEFEDIGTGEGGDMTLIYLPLQKIMFTGDVVNNHMHPFLAEGRFSDWIEQIEYIKENYSDAKVLFPGHGQSSLPLPLLDEQLEYINTFRSLVEQQIQSTRSANITEEGKASIQSELESIYPDYLHVAAIPLETMLDLNIDAIAREMSTSISLQME